MPLPTDRQTVGVDRHTGPMKPICNATTETDSNIWRCDAEAHSDRPDEHYFLSQIR